MKCFCFQFYRLYAVQKEKLFVFEHLLVELEIPWNERIKVTLSTSATLTCKQGFQWHPRFNRVTLGVVLNICKCSKLPLHTVCVSCAPSPAGLSGSLWGVKCMQADGRSVTCRSFSPRSVEPSIKRVFHLLIFGEKGNTTPHHQGLVRKVVGFDSLLHFGSDGIIKHQ